MNRRIILGLLLVLGAGLVAGTFSLQSTSAQNPSGGVDKDGEWYVGEGLEQGDYFSYRLCHVDYNECTPFVMNFWLKEDISDEIGNRWLTEVVVYDGNKTIVGEMELGKIVPEPIDSSAELGIYRHAFKSSITWLSSYANVSGYHAGPQAFRDLDWTKKICDPGCPQIRSTAIETVTVPAGTWETILLTWYTGGKPSNAWIADGFPFPIKAKTFTFFYKVAPALEHEFELLDYKENVQESPFEGMASSHDAQTSKGCPQTSEKASIKKLTKDFQYKVHVHYGPEHPVQGCYMQWLIKFVSKFDDAEFLNQVQYDLLVVDEDLNTMRSIAEEEGRQFLYSPSGQAIVDMIVKEEPGTVHYVVWVYGQAPESVVPSTPDDYLQIDVPISAPYIPSPLAQYNSGIPIQEIQCRDSRILMETLRGTPACVYEKSVDTMQQRGWIVAHELQDNSDIGTSAGNKYNS